MQADPSTGAAPAVFALRKASKSPRDRVAPPPEATLTEHLPQD